MKISIIIPCYNSEKVISKCLNSLLNQNFQKKDYEIIVVDDGSVDNTIQILKKYKNKINVLKQQHAGPAKARNLGARKAKGNLLLFTDCDCVPDKNWIKNMVLPFNSKYIVGVSGTYRTLNKEEVIARFEGYCIEYNHERMKKQKYIDFIGTFSAGYRKNIFNKFNGFSTKFKTSSGEDVEFSYRISKAGYKMVFQPEAFVYHPHPSSIIKYLKQKYWRGYWRNLMYKDNKNKVSEGDSYTSNTLSTQIFFSGLLSLFIVPLLFLNFTLTSIVLSLIIGFIIISIIFNLKLLSFLSKREMPLIIIAPIILSLRNFVVIFGILHGMIKLNFNGDKH